MSRIGRMPIHLPAGVEVTVGENNVVTVKGPKGTLTQALYPTMKIQQEGRQKRHEAEQEMQRLENELKGKLLQLQG